MHNLTTPYHRFYEAMCMSYRNDSTSNLIPVPVEGPRLHLAHHAYVPWLSTEGMKALKGVIERLVRRSKALLGKPDQANQTHTLRALSGVDMLVETGFKPGMAGALS